MTPESLARMLETYLAEARDAVVLEDGQTIFDLAAGANPGAKFP
ncbi:MAG TPA: hypothetical protein VGQ94_10490 [Terriglobales bacterium]|nr:hypothetical protein [Terriglobales bacterium]